MANTAQASKTDSADGQDPSATMGLAPNSNRSSTILRCRFILSERQTAVCEIALKANASQSTDQKQFLLELGAAALRKLHGFES